MSFPSSGQATDLDHVHDNQVVALFATDGEAQAAKASLIANGLPPAAIQVVYRGDEATPVPAKADSSIWSAIGSLFVPDEDRNSFTHAVGHGHALLLVTPPEGADRHMVIRTLDAAHPVDFDAKLEEWRMSGYDYSSPHEHYAAASQPAGGAAPVGFASGTGGNVPAKDNTGPIGGTVKQDVMAGNVGTTHASPTPQADARPVQREPIEGTSRVRSYVAPRLPTTPGQSA